MKRTTVKFRKEQRQWRQKHLLTKDRKTSTWKMYESKADKVKGEIKKLLSADMRVDEISREIVIERKLCSKRSFYKYIEEIKRE